MLRTLQSLLRAAIEFRTWQKRSWASPAPNFVKRQVLRRHSSPSATWVETGTYLGETSRYLARSGSAVISLEPSPYYYALAKRKLRSFKNVKLINGSSETHFSGVINSLSGEVCFWLDGHHSGGQTFRGAMVSPVLKELEEISRARTRFSSIRVMVDDVRLFPVGSHKGEPGYPPITSLTDFAESNGFTWTIEHDIFIALLEG